MLGDTAGRSRRHPTGEGAIARSTARQRAALAPPPGQQYVTVRTRERYKAMITRDIVVSGALLVLGSLIVVLADRQLLELVGLAPILLALVLAGVSRPWKWVRTDLVYEDRPEAERVSRR